MPEAYYVQCYELGAADDMQKSANAGTETCRNIMRQIYNEDPSYWPYGLRIEGHQSVYLIKDAHTHTPVGFVGWQEFREFPRMQKVGSYSIGILPEYRRHGYATEAVAKILLEKAAGVDEVRCYAVKGNTKSRGLAAKLHMPVKEKF